MRLQINESNKKISLDEINKFQKRWKISLPSEYIDFMLESNGGISEYSCLFKSKQKKNILNGDWVRYFYSLNEINNFLKLIKKPPQEYDYPDFVVYNKMIKTQKIPIARGDSYMLCMDISSEDSSGIYYLYLEDDKELSFIIESFRDFINSFEPEIINKPLYKEFIEKGKYKELKKLIENGLDLSPKPFYDSPIEYLLHMGKYESEGIKKIELLEIIFNKDIYKENLLQPASVPWEKNNYEIIEFLIKKGCNVNFRDDSGYTPLFLASIRSKEIVKLLIENKADVTIKNNLGERAIDWCKKNNNNLFIKEDEKNEIIKMLEEAEKIQN